MRETAQHNRDTGQGSTMPQETRQLVTEYLSLLHDLSEHGETLECQIVARQELADYYMLLADTDAFLN